MPKGCKILLLKSVLEILKLRYGQFDVSKAERTDFRQDPNIDKLIASVSLGDIPELPMWRRSRY